METSQPASSLYVLMVCTGNTCRSPIAEYMLRHKLQQAGRTNVVVASAGLMAADDQPASGNGVEVMQQLGIDLTPHKSQPLLADDVLQADLILTMEQYHADNITRMFPRCATKTFVLTEFGSQGMHGKDVPDPVGGPRDMYEQVAMMVETCLDGLLSKLDSIIAARDNSVAIGTDHRGYELKEQLSTALAADGYHLVDCGTSTPERCDFPVFALDVAERVAFRETGCGILVCSSGIGMSIAANKVRGVRAALVHSDDDARLCREHNNANVLVLPGTGLVFEQALAWARLFLTTEHLGDRYHMRNTIIALYEAGYSIEDAAQQARRAWENASAQRRATDSDERKG